MTAAAEPRSTLDKSAMSRLLRTWLLIAVVDGLFAVALTFIYQRPQARLWQGLAAVPFGQGMIDGGAPAVALGVAIHFAVAFTWSAIFLVLFMRSGWLRQVLESRYGALKVATVYGPAIWVAMSLAIIPLFTHQIPAITYRWWIQLAGHIVFVGLPITWSTSRR